METVQTNAKVGKRPSKPRFKPGDTISNSTVIDYVGFGPTYEGNQHIYKLRCSCGSTFTTNQKRIVNKWRSLLCDPSGNYPLHCKKCADKARGHRVSGKNSTLIDKRNERIKY